VEHNNETTAAEASVDDAAHAVLLDDLMGRAAPCFARRETRLTCRDMACGLLMELDDHNCWTMAEAAGHPGPYRMQHLLSRARCDDQGILDTVADWAAGHLAGGDDSGGDAVLLTASLSRISRHLGKLMRAMEYLLAHDVPMLTANYLLRPREVWVRRGELAPVDHRDPLAALRDPRGLSGVHRAVAAKVVKQMEADARVAEARRRT